MEFTGITTIWATTPEEFKLEFTTEFNRMTEEEDVEGIHVFYFCRYKEYKIYTEQLTAHIYKDTVLFYLYGGSMVIDLDEQMQIKSGDIIPITNLIESALLGEKPVLECLNWVCTPEGNGFDVYSLKFENPLRRAYEIIDNEDYNISGLNVVESELIDISLLLLKAKIEQWESEINNSVSADQASPTIDDNPFANQFYDREEDYQMRNEKIRLGDKEV